MGNVCALICHLQVTSKHTLQTSFHVITTSLKNMATTLEIQITLPSSCIGIQTYNGAYVCQIRPTATSTSQVIATYVLETNIATKLHLYTMYTNCLTCIRGKFTCINVPHVTSNTVHRQNLENIYHPLKKLTVERGFFLICSFKFTYLVMLKWEIF